MNNKSQQKHQRKQQSSSSLSSSALSTIQTIGTTTTNKSSFATPYILNGEFYEILSQVGEGVTVRCCKCPGDNIYKGSVKSTGNFHMHIKRKHSEFLPRVHEMKLKSFTERKFKMPQKRQSYGQGRRKVITKCEKNYEKNFTPHDMQSLPIDYRKKPKIMDNMIFTQIHNQQTNQNQHYLPKLCPLSSSSQTKSDNIIFYAQNCEPPPAHQSQMDYITTNPFQIPVTNNNNNATVQEKLPKIQSVVCCNQNNEMQMMLTKPNMPSLISTSTTLASQHQQPLQYLSTTTTPPPLVKTVTTIPGHDVLLRVENHLKGIEREMRLRNQIESNRLCLDLAKFKFLHPNFAIQN